ncbi:MAG: hypothetical protein DHS80DRAFT_29519 [Piptocephalis tieghemiana]|nr:MAG: hypothetical protein DHS80DRAFT_29519 [Piptocephalis tieghemiana]
MARSHRSWNAVDIVTAILTLLLPPLAVFIKRGIRLDFWINLLLTILGWFPGVIHAWIIIFIHKGGDEDLFNQDDWII